MNPQNPLPPPAPPTPQPAPSDVRQQVIARLKEADHILVTVSNNPSVDQLAAAIGFTLVLNKLKKHGTAVFSGQIPSTIEFLQPDKTIEKNTDSLRDFIIALDKAKADKLRYKIEDKFVKIFITPYRTSIDEKDLEFSQGDFNVEVVLALGVKKRDELDQAITAHGRILHDATVIDVNIKPGENLGNLNWNVPGASSYSEVLVNVADLIRGETDKVFDPQIATAFLTGIVAETERFSNEKTSPQTMSMASILMNAGANQQLIATKLEEPKEIPPAEPAKTPGAGDKPKTDPNAVRPLAAPPAPAQPPKPQDGALKVAHDFDKPADVSYKTEGGETASPNAEKTDVEEIHIDEQGILRRLDEMETEKKPDSLPVVEPPKAKPTEPVKAEDGKPEGQKQNEPVAGETIPDTLTPEASKPKASQQSVDNGPESTLPDKTEPAAVIPAKRHMLSDPPTGGDQFTALTGSEGGDEAPPSELNLPSVNGSLLSHNSGSAKPQPEEGVRSAPLAAASKPLDLNGDDEDTSQKNDSGSSSSPPPVPPPMTPPASQPPAGPSPSQQASAVAL